MNKIIKIAKEIVYDYKDDTKVKNAMNELLNETIMSKIVKSSNNNVNVINAKEELFDAIKQSKETFTKVENCAFTDSVINIVANIKSVKYNSRETIIF